MSAAEIGSRSQARAKAAGASQCRHRRGDSAAALAKQIVHQLNPAQRIADRKRPARTHEMVIIGGGATSMIAAFHSAMALLARSHWA